MVLIIWAFLLNWQMFYIKFFLSPGDVFLYMREVRCNYKWPLDSHVNSWSDENVHTQQTY